MTDYSAIFQQAGKQYNIDPRLLAAVAQTESSGNPDAVSPAGAMGLMQLMPATAQALGVKDPTDPTQAIPAAAQLLSQNLSRYGNVEDALRAYNGGTDPSKWSNPETAAYVPKVAAAYQALGQQPAGQQTVQNGASDVPLTTTPALPDAFGAAFGKVVPSPAAPAAQPTADPFSQAFGPALASAAAPDTSKPGFWTNLVSGLEHGVSGSGPVGSALNSAVSWGDKNIPGAQALDNTIGRTADVNQQAIAGSVAGQTAFQQGPGQTLGGQLGNAASTIALTAPLAEVGAGAIGGALGVGADAVQAGSVANRLLAAGKAAATGSASNFGGKLLAGATSGALKGAIASTAAGGDPTTGAEYGAALGPVGAAAGAVAAPIARGMMLLGGKAGNAVLDSLGAPAARDAAASAPGTAAPAAAATPSVNPLTGAPIEAAQQIPTSLPKAPVIASQAGASAYADKIIQHFAQGGPTDIKDNALIAGSQPTLAQATGNAGLATLERGVQSQSPQAFALRWEGNNAARSQVISGLTGTPGDIDAATAARDAMTSAARNAAFAGAQPVDAQPVVDQVQQLIAQNAGRPTVQAPLQQVLNQLAPEGKPPVSDPATLYNVRKYIGDIISPKAAGTAQDGRAAAAQLMTLKPVLDDTIESGAPGYKAYIQQFDQLSQPINGMQALQKLNLFDARGNVTMAKLDNAVKSITNQQNAPGYKLADSITPEQMQQLVALRDDMRREGLSSLGRSLGSNTFQNFATNSLMNAAGSRGAHVVGAAMSALGGDAALGPVGAFAGPALSYAASHMAGKMSENARSMVMESLVNKLLNPQAAAGALQAVARKAGPSAP
jgi:hypothetical protein